MGKPYGSTGQILRVHLTDRTVSVIPTERYQEFIGGLGINQYVLLEELESDVHPLSPENLLIFGAGPLVGTPAFSSSRLSIDCKNVLTGGVGSANAGGHFSAELKRSGYDHMIISGKSDTPVVLFVHDERVLFLDASHLWGKGTQETFQSIKQEQGDPRIQVAAIGPAGENSVQFACIMVEQGRAAGFSGCGAVMGSKNLKAVAVRGDREIALAHPAYLDGALKKIRERFDISPSLKKMRLGGTHLIAAAGGPNHTNPQAVRNHQDEIWTKEKSRKITEPMFKPYEVERLACFNCPVRCSHLYEIPEGENKGKRLEGTQANTVRAFSSNLDVADPLVVLNGNFLCNDLGLDVDGTAVSLGWAFECYEKGIFTDKDTDGLQLTWGNSQAALSLIRAIALRRGIGDLLAEGAARAAEKIGQGTAAFAMHVKGAPINDSNLRTHKGWALGIGTSTRGAGHLRGAPNTEQKRIPADISQKIWGIPSAGDPAAYEGKAKLVAWFEAYKAVVDSLGVCYFTSYWRNTDLLSPQDLSDLLYGVTGRRLEEQALMAVGERIINIEKAFNTLHAGFTRKDDDLPERLFTTSISTGPFKGEHLHRQQWDKMLDEYYLHHQWDAQTGWQTETCVEALELPAFVKERLKQKNRLPGTS